MKKKVVVGLSGGVDSSVSAYFLKEQGYDVLGLFMKNWDEDSPGACEAAEDFADVARIAEVLQIPYYSVDFTQEYRDLVFSSFLEDLKQGLTPNPDVLCNQKIKFHVFWEKAKSLGADYLATGHYCQATPEGALHKGADPDKDQSYFLHAVSSSVLQKTLFPIGHLRKEEVRRLAKSLGLCVHDKKDSTGICFIGKRNFQTFVTSFLGASEGHFLDEKGNILGKHQGSFLYTIGQRKGLGIGGPGDAWFVIGKDHKKNVVILAQGKEHPALFTSSISASHLHWIKQPPKAGSSLHAKIRYRQTDAPCSITSLTEEGVSVTFREKQRAATPGQFLVFYEGTRCLGGGKIVSNEVNSPTKV
ncbi:MAG: tRNA 2-thiouridine(34) synthase MnmA [Chlamydiota bacterium]